MKKYLEYKNKVQGLKDVFETVKIAEKIAASHIHLLKKEVESLHLYTKSLEKIISRILSFYQVKDNFFLSQKKHGKNILVAITGNKGLVGGLYHNIVSSLLERVESYQVFINIGNKGERYLREENIKISKSFLNISNIPQPQEIMDIANYIFSEFQKENIKKIDILYPKFISLSQCNPIIVQFLPFKFNLNEINSGISLPSQTNESLGIPIFEPSAPIIFNKLIKKYIKVFFYKIIMEAKLSEVSSRTIATEHAAAKTKQDIQKLIVEYLKERRKIITQKQIESFVVHQTI